MFAKLVQFPHLWKKFVDQVQDQTLRDKIRPRRPPDAACKYTRAPFFRRDPITLSKLVQSKAVHCDRSRIPHLLLVKSQNVRKCYVEIIFAHFSHWLNFAPLCTCIAISYHHVSEVRYEEVLKSGFGTNSRPELRMLRPLCPRFFRTLTLHTCTHINTYRYTRSVSVLLLQHAILCHPSVRPSENLWKTSEYSLSSMRPLSEHFNSCRGANNLIFRNKKV